MDTPDSPTVSALEQCRYLWEEYKYRHDLIWQRTFTFTTAIVLVSIIPYLEQGIARQLKGWTLIAPSLAFLLASLGLLVMNNELGAIGKIKTEYRIHQNALLGHDLNDPTSTGTFRYYVTAYFISLLVLTIVNMFVVNQVWMPGLLAQPVSFCP